MHRKAAPDTRTMLAALTLTVVGASAFLVMPVLLGAAVADLGLTDAEVGYLGSAGLAGSAVAAVFAALLVRNVSWRHIAGWSLLCQAGGLLAAAGAADFTAALLPILLASAGGGAVYSLALTVLSDHSQAARFFGYSVTAQVAFQVAGLSALAWFTVPGGFASAAWILAGMAILSLLLVPVLPHAGAHDPQTPKLGLSTTFKQGAALLALLGCALFFVNIGAVWAYIERLGSNAGFSPATLGGAMAASVAFGMAGSMSAAWQGRRFGFAVPIAAAAAATVAALVLLSPGMSLAMFVAAFGLYNFAWNYSLAYQYATVSHADRSGRLVAAAPALHAVGGAMGPLLIATLMDGNGLQLVNWLAAIAVVLSAAALLPAARLTRQ